jgi:hypothetical protein
LVERFDFGQDFQTRTIGEHQIEEDDIDLFVAENSHALCCGGRLVTVETIAPQEGPEHILKDGLVIDYED